MKTWKGLVATAIIGGTIAFGTAHAAEDKLTYPTVLDTRMYIYEIDQDFVRIYAPEDFGHKLEEQDDMHELALWACKLYNRVAAPWISYQKDENVGGVYYLFVCAVP